MTREDILKNLQELVDSEEIEMQYEDDNHLFVCDYVNSKDIVYNLNMTFRELLSKIFISSRVPKKYRPHKQKLASYLLKHLSHDAFWTLNKIYILWGGEDDFEEMCADQDEEYWDFDDDVLGLTWFYKNCVFVNIGAILRAEEEIAKEDIAVLGWSLSSDRDVCEQAVITLVHELRHLMLDTNIVLDEDEYPVNLASEDKVEAFARKVVDEHGFDVY